MSGSVEQVRPGIYRVRVYVGDDKVRSKTYPAANMREAKKLANGHADAILAGRKLEVAKRGTVTELVDTWLEFQHGLDRSPTTLYRLKSITARIKADIGHLQRRELTGHQVNQFYAGLRKTVVSAAKDDQPARYMTESTVHHYHRVLRSILMYGEKHDLVDYVVTRKAERPNPIEHTVDVPSDEVMERLFSTAPAAIQLAIKVDAFLGLRRGELFGLRWSDLRGGVAYISHNTVVIPKVGLVDKTPKSRRPREVPMVDEIQMDLADLRRRQELYAGRDGVVLAPDARVMADQSADPTGRTPLSPTWLSQAWAKHCRKQGHPVRLHDCRHWCASKLLNAGVPLKTVQEILGHASWTTTQRYAHVLEGSHDVARAAMSGNLRLMALPKGDVPS